MIWMPQDYSEEENIFKQLRFQSGEMLNQTMLYQMEFHPEDSNKLWRVSVEWLCDTVRKY